MFDESSWRSINRRCLEEALSVQDMLSPTPPTRTWFARAQDRCVATVDFLHAVTCGLRHELHHCRHAGQTPTVASKRSVRSDAFRPRSVEWATGRTRPIECRGPPGTKSKTARRAALLTTNHAPPPRDYG
jgi:hypothetical protein